MLMVVLAVGGHYLQQLRHQAQHQIINQLVTAGEL